jgi:hypothetical protein
MKNKKPPKLRNQNRAIPPKISPRAIKEGEGSPMTAAGGALVRYFGGDDAECHALEGPQPSVLRAGAGQVKRVSG